LFTVGGWLLTRRPKRDENVPNSEKLPIRPLTEAEELLIWAWEQRRFDILALSGIWPMSSNGPIFVDFKQ
jgi:hypothetical protein